MDFADIRALASGLIPLGVLAFFAIAFIAGRFYFEVLGEVSRYRPGERVENLRWSLGTYVSYVGVPEWVKKKYQIYRIWSTIGALVICLVIACEVITGGWRA